MAMPLRFLTFTALYLILVNLSGLLTQDILFPDKTQLVPRPWTTIWTTRRPPTIAAITSSKPKNCERLCVVLDLCPALYKLLDNPTRQNMKLLQISSCGFTTTGDPLVWCDDFVCDPAKTRGQNNNNGQSKSEIVFFSDQKAGREQQTVELMYESSRPDVSTRSAFPSPVADPSPVPEAKISPFKFPTSMTPMTTTGQPVSRHKETGADLNSADCGIAFPSRISGGSNAGKGEFPWIVAISVHSRTGLQVICGGALISNGWVLTAAHCVADSGHNLRNISHVRVGAHNITNMNEAGAENVGVRRIVLHEDFRERPLVKNDIALVQLERNLVSSMTVGPICLPMGGSAQSTDTLSTLYKPGESATIAGWGSDGAETSYNILQKVDVPLVDGDECRRAFYRVRVRVVPSIQICAGEPKKDSCKGDSGGPLMMDVDGRVTLIGIISYGTTQCDGRLPGVYTKATSYMQWIREHVQ